MKTYYALLHCNGIFIERVMLKCLKPETDIPEVGTDIQEHDNVPTGSTQRDENEERTSAYISGL